MKFPIITPKKELFIKIICILILSGLCIAIYVNGIRLDCNNCKIHFESYKTGYILSSERVYQDFYIKIIDMFEYFNRDECVVIFTEDDGYINKMGLNNDSETKFYP